MTDNPFELNPDYQKEFLRKYPQWIFHNCWKPYNGLRGFNLFNFWWWENGTLGVCLLNFGVEYNPYHEDAE
jgi:hypothetical protein